MPGLQEACHHAAYDTPAQPKPKRGTPGVWLRVPRACPPYAAGPSSQITWCHSWLPLLLPKPRQGLSDRTRGELERGTSGNRWRKGNSPTGSKPRKPSTNKWCAAMLAATTVATYTAAIVGSSCSRGRETRPALDPPRDQMLVTSPAARKQQVAARADVCDRVVAAMNADNDGDGDRCCTHAVVLPPR